LKQEVAPKVDDQEPGLHEVHSRDPEDDHDPAAQWAQSVMEAEPKTLEEVPALQLTHVEADEAAWTVDHVPSLQAMHTSLMLLLC
jgi:hypothetical protein